MIVPALLLAALLSASPPAPAPVLPVSGTVILGRAGQDALYLWDATPYVAALVQQHDTDARGMRELQATAVSILVSKAHGSSSQTLTVRVVYTQSGQVSPAYGTLTFNGVERVCTVTVPVAAANKDGATWAAAIAGGAAVPGVKIDVTGKLPPS